jgi:hypothetical protein
MSVRVRWMLAAEYATFDAQGRPVIAGVYDRITLNPARPQLLFAAVACLEGEDVEARLEHLRWRLSFPGTPATVEVPFSPPPSLPPENPKVFYAATGGMTPPLTKGEILVAISDGMQVLQQLVVPVDTAGQ